MLRLHEGVKKHGYLCTAGKMTVGVGRNIDKEGGLGLSEDEIDYLLANDIKRVDAELVKSFAWYSSLDDVRKDAMINLTFNVGITRLKGFVKALTAMEQKNYPEAAAQFLDSAWSKQVGKRSVDVTNLIKTGSY
jgi:lysozyme